MKGDNKSETSVHISKRQVHSHGHRKGYHVPQAMGFEKALGTYGIEDCLEPRILAVDSLIEEQCHSSACTKSRMKHSFSYEALDINRKILLSIANKTKTQ